MGPLLIVVVLFFLFDMTRQLHKDAAYDSKVKIQVKKCPPHSWFWQEILDQDGNRVGERIVCKTCGPLSSSLNGENNV